MTQDLLAMIAETCKDARETISKCNNGDDAKLCAETTLTIIAGMCGAGMAILKENKEVKP